MEEKFSEDRILDHLFQAIIELVSILNRPDRDKKLIAQAGVHLEDAAFRVLAGIGHMQAASVGELAGMMGRNYSSVSRQIDKLEAAGLVRTYPSPADSRMRMSELTEDGKNILTMIQSTRQRIMREALGDWTQEEKISLLQHLTRLNDLLKKWDNT
jgi:DNA-binding MarR family transcriptional regulator